YLANHGADRSTVDAVRSSLRTAQSSRGGAGIGLAIGIAVSVYGAAGAFGAAGRALNRAMRLDEGRGIVRRKALDLACTLVVIVLAVVALLLVFLGGFLRVRRELRLLQRDLRRVRRCGDPARVAVADERRPAVRRGGRRSVGGGQAGGGSANVCSSGHEHSEPRPGQPAHSSRFGRGLT